MRKDAARWTLLGAFFLLLTAAAEGGMTRDEAVQLIKSFLAVHKAQGPGLNDKNLGGVEIGGQPVYFEYVPEKKVLRASALVYRFRKPPRPGVLDGFHKEEKAGTDTGGGSVEYQGESKSLLLTRTYPAVVSEGQFSKDLTRLMDAGRKWNAEVVERVATRVNEGK